MSTNHTSWRPAAAAVFASAWGGNHFTPLLLLYRQHGMSPVQVDSLLGAYVLGLVPALLLVGPVTERHGRRPVMIAGVVLSLLASGLIAVGSTGWIAAGRMVAGVAVAIAMSVGTTWVSELSERGGESLASGARRAALWLTLGFGIGAGVSGVLAQWGPAPTVLPYAVHAVVAIACLVPLFRVAETREPAPATPGSSRFVRARHPRFLRVVLPMAPWIFGSAGIAYAVMPQLVAEQVGGNAIAYATLLTVLTLGAGALVQPVARRLDRTTSARAVAVSMAAMSAGLVLAGVVAAVRSPWLALVAAVVLGSAYGIAVVSGLLEIQRLARPGEMASLTGVYYALAYSGFLLPALLAVSSAVLGYPALLAILVLVALSGTALIVANTRRFLPAEL
ncbi:MFS transporter [Pseudonocardia phyllosphaerae]|uniref:MFS transporter n=1 Tax=Pseudonocardia phyllosphaerae TaxID=3390502 RepID=UPI0039795A29